MNHFGTVGEPAYDENVAGTPAARCENRNPTRRSSAWNRRFFCGRFTLNGGLREATERLAGVLVGQFLTLALVRHLRCEKRNGGFHPTRSQS